MKNRTIPTLTRSFLQLGAVLCLALWAAGAQAATTLYFDSNGASPGYGAGGNWDAPNWAASPGGTSTTANWVAGGFPRFYTAVSSTVTIGLSETNVGMYEQVDAVTLTILATNTAGNLYIATNGGALVSGNFVQGFFIGTNNSANSSLVLSCPVVGPGGIEQENFGALSLFGTNTYTGGTDLTGGQITYYNNNASFGTGTVIINGTGQGLVSTAAIALTIPNNFSFPTANYNLNLAGGNPVAGAPGTTFTGTFTLPGSGTITLLTSSSASQVDQISGVISGASALAVGNLGELILTGNNTYSGGTFVYSGTLDAKSAGAIPGNVTVTNGTLIVDAAIPGNITLTGGSAIINASIPGNITVNGGAVQLNLPNAMSSVATLNLPAVSTNSVNLNFTGVNNILALNLGGVSMAQGTWGAPGSSATFTNSAFTGTGILFVSVSTATNFFWDANHSDATAGNSESGGGSGNWDNVTADWWIAGGADTAWQSGYIANFGGTAGTVTVADNITSPDALNFTTAGYVITNAGGSVINLTNPATAINLPTGTTTIGASLAGQGVLISGPGTLILSGANTYTGTTLLTNGSTIVANAIADSGTSSIGYGPVRLAGGTLSYTGPSAATTTRAFPVSAGSSSGIDLPAGNLTLNTAVTASGAFSIKKTGNGTLTLGGTTDNAFFGLNLVGGTVILNKTVAGHAIGNPVTVGSGTLLQLSGAGYGQEIYSGAPVAINSGGLFDLNGQTTPMSVLTLPGNGPNNVVLTNSAAAAGGVTASTINLLGNTTMNSTGPISLSGTIQGSYGMTQAGSGMLTLASASTFNGGLTINAGTTAQINNGTGAGQGTVALGANGNFNVNISNGTLGNPVTGPSSAIVNIMETSNQNLTISSSMTGFTGTMNCPASAGVPGSTSKAQMTSTAFAINPAANINVAAGGTLYVVNPGVTIPCALNLYGLGNIEAYGALRIEKGSVISGPVNLLGNTTIGNGVSGAANLATISGVISGGFGVTYTAEPGTIALAGANTYTGTTTLSNGCVIQLGSAENPGTSGPLGKSAASNPGSIVMYGGTLQYSSANNNDYSGRFSTSAATQRYNIDVNGRTVTLATPLVSAGGSLALSSSIAGGTLVLSAANTYSGSTTNSSGILQLAGADVPGTSGPLGSSVAAGSILMNGGQLQYTAANGAHDYSGRFSTNASQNFNIDVNGQGVTFASALVSPSGVLSVSSTSAGGTLTLTGTNAYTGATTVNTGSTLTISGAGNLGNVLGTGFYAGGITVNGTFNYASSTSQTLLGAVTGLGSLVVSGTGTLTVSNAANAWFGGTTVNNGVLNVNATGTIYGNVTVAGGVLQLGNPSALDSAAILTLPGSPAAGTVNLNFSGVQTVAALNFGGTSMAPGTYGAPGNGSVTYQNAAFTGSGILSVSGQGAYWDPGLANAAPGSGGTGNWDATTANWVIAGADAPWAITNIANFAGSAGSVTLNANQTVSGLIFTTAGYDLTGGSTLNFSGLAANGTPIVSVPAGNTTIDCAVASTTASNAVVVTGPGALTLTGSNAGLTNGFVVTGGATLSVNTIADAGNGTTAIGTGPNVTLYNGNLTFTGSSGLTARTLTLQGPVTANLNVAAGNTLEWDGQVHIISDTAPQALTFSGGGTLMLGGSIDNSGLEMAINAGTVIITKNSASGVHGLGGGTTTIASGATLQLSGSGNFDLYSGCLVAVASGGVLDLDGQNDSFSTLTLSGSGIGGNGALVNSSASSGITNGGSGVVLAGNTTIGGPGNIFLASAVSGPGMSLTYNNASGQLLLGAANTFSGGLNVGANSTVALNNATAAGPGTITLGSSGNLIVGYSTVAGITVANAITGGSSSVVQVNEPAGNTFITGSLAGFNGTINVESATNGSGQLIINNINNALNPISASATWHIMNGATLDLATPVVTDAASVILDGSGNNQAFGSLRLDCCNQQGNVLLNGPNCVIGDGNTTGPSTISGVISDGGNAYGFTKVGTNNTIVLTAVNTYTGPTIINNGTLAIGSSGSIAGSSAIYITNGAALDVSQVGGGYSLGASQTLGNLPAGTGAAIIGGSLNLTAGTLLSLQYTNTAPLVVSNGTLALANNPFTVTILGPNGPQAGSYPLISGVSGPSPGTITGSVASSPITITGQIANTVASLSISNNTLYLNIILAAPTILSQAPIAAPSPGLLYVGAHASFSVNAIGAAPLQYLWYTNGTQVGGATNPSLSLFNIQGVSLTAACIVSNSFNIATANWADTILTDPTNPYPVTILTDNPLGYWRLNETNNPAGNNGFLADDYWGGNHGVYSNVNLAISPGYSSVTDSNETCVQVGIVSSDSDAYGIPGINFGTANGGTTTFSVEAWVNGGVQTKDAGIVSLGYGGGGEQFNLDTGSDSLASHGFRFFVRDAAGNTHSSASAVTASGSWQHIVGVCDESNGIVSLYVNGVLAASGNGTIGTNAGILASTRNMIIGGRPSASVTNNNWDFNGYINDVSVYNYALSPTQVVAHYVSAGVPPSFAQVPPASISTNSGVNLFFPVTALGTPPLAYYWADLGGGTNLLVDQTNGDVINASLAINNLPPGWNGDTLSLTVSNVYGTTNILIPFTVASTLQAALVPDNTNLTITAGEVFTYTAVAQGAVPITYQWYLGDVSHPILNATNASYATVVTLASSNYVCRVTDPNGSIELPATLTGVPYLTLDWTGVGWSAANQSGTFATTPAAFNNGVLTLTDGGGSESRSVFFALPQYVSAFEAAFTYQAGGNRTADGIAFVLQNDSRGASAIGAGGGQLGIGTNNAIKPSAELELNLYTGSSEVRGYGFFTNGLTGASGGNGNYKGTGSLSLASGDPIDVLLYYSQGHLSLTFTDAVAQVSFSTNLNIPNLRTVLGSDYAYVGFTGASGGSTAVQTVTDFTFLSLMTLTTQVSGSNLILSWPSDVSLYQLQSTTDLSSLNWVNVPNPVTVVGNMNQVTVPATGVQSYYRLVLQ